MATHHIARQRLVLEGSGIAPPTVGKWYARLEQLQRTTLLPTLERVLDRLDDRSTTTYIERLEVTVHLDDTPAQLSRHLEQALQTHLVQEQAAQYPRSLPEEVLYFLRTGNLPVAYPDLPSFQRRLTSWEPDGSAWRRILELAATDLDAFLGRGTQVNSHFLERSWRWLITVGGKSATGEPMPVAGDAQAWCAAFAAAGLPVHQPHRVPAVRETGISQTAERPGGSPPVGIREEPQRTEVGPAYYPENAGLVLLHAYLPYLLREVKCAVTQRTQEHLSRAATLLHYLAYGEIGVAEWQLPLTKLLLGLHPDDYLVPASSLPVADRRAADDLLSDVIDHWAALGNTRIDALRDSFLQRPGKLEATPGGWQLSVERRAYDLLLNRLPWSIGMVKTPWMKRLLRVDWA